MLTRGLFFRVFLYYVCFDITNKLLMTEIEVDVLLQCSAVVEIGIRRIIQFSPTTLLAFPYSQSISYLTKSSARYNVHVGIRPFQEGCVVIDVDPHHGSFFSRLPVSVRTETSSL